MRSSLTHDREFYDCLARHESLRRLRHAFDAFLGQPIWWMTFKVNGNPKAFVRSIESSYEIWNDPRVKRFPFLRPLYAALQRHSRHPHAFSFVGPKDVLHFCVPLGFGNRVIGFLGVSGLKKELKTEALNLLAESTKLAVEACSKNEELKRLSATIRPRAIALSTVHTVHRIINSTLNLEELISRLAHLTSQVLRAYRCAIYLAEKPSSRKWSLIPKALVGYSKRVKKSHPIPFGAGLEGHVAKTAKIILRKKLISIPLIDEDVIGVVTVSYKKDGKGFTAFDQEILTTLAEEAVIAIKNAQLYEEQKKVTLGTIQSLAVILGTRVESVISPEAFLKIALKIAGELRLNEEETQALHYATLLKDTAKIGIPDEILKKPTKLTGEEYRLLRSHPIKGAQIVQSFESLKPVVPIILYSRERYDGTGYPKGLKGEQIPIGARILSVITAFEAIVIGRPYRDRSSFSEALDEIINNSGTQFDPKVVEIFTRLFRRGDFRRFMRKPKEA